MKGSIFFIGENHCKIIQPDRKMKTMLLFLKEIRK